MTPSLTLRYSSNAGDSRYLGYGWTLDIGSLTRGGIRDNPVPPDSFQDLDASASRRERISLSVWGGRQELAVKSALELWPIHESHWRVAGALGAFDGFVARDPDGRRHHFTNMGSLAGFEQRATNEQVLTRVDSVDGKTSIFVEYERGPSLDLDGVDVGARAAYPRFIDYGCSDPTTDACYQVELRWEQRDPLFTAARGELVAWGQRLSDIIVRANGFSPNGSFIRRYHLSYDLDQVNERSLLSEVYQLNNAEEPLYTPTRLHYQPSTMPDQSWDEVGTLVPYRMRYWSQTDGGVVVSDVDHDALPDLFGVSIDRSNLPSVTPSPSRRSHRDISIKAMARSKAGPSPRRSCAGRGTSDTSQTTLRSGPTSAQATSTRGPKTSASSTDTILGPDVSVGPRRRWSQTSCASPWRSLPTQAAR